MYTVLKKYVHVVCTYSFNTLYIFPVHCACTYITYYKNVHCNKKAFVFTRRYARCPLLSCHFPSIFAVRYTVASSFSYAVRDKRRSIRANSEARMEVTIGKRGANIQKIDYRHHSYSKKAHLRQNTVSVDTKCTPKGYGKEGSRQEK